MIRFATFVLTLFAAHFAFAAEPDFGPNVLIFDPSIPDIQQHINKIFATQENGEFNSHRYAYLFKPGKYNLDVQMGYYMQVLGLGQSPDDVEITGAVRSKATWMKGNATINFWRSAENLAVVPTLDQKIDVWAVSQGTALRRIHVKGDLVLSDHGWSSGGFIADCKIDGTVDAGTQQQWISRNAEWTRWQHGDWNMVFVGCDGAPTEPWPTRPYTVVEKTPLVAEKPYLFIDEAGDYFVRVPAVANDSRGITWSHGTAPGRSIPIEQFYIARSETDTAVSINAALSAGKNLLLTPGG